MELEILHEFNRKEVNQFSYENNLYQQKENIFKSTDEEINTHISYGDQPYIPLSNDTSKPCFKLLFSLNIPSNVKQKVEEKILASGKKLSSITPEIICSLIIIAYGNFGLEFDLENIIRMCGLNPYKNKVTEFISKVTTKDINILEEEDSVGMFISYPSKYISEVFNLYINKFCINFTNKDNVINKIVLLTETLEKCYPTIIQLFPREAASGIIFLYLKDSNINKPRKLFSETIFSELPLVQKSKFKKCLESLKLIFTDFASKNWQYYLSFHQY